MPRIQQSLFEYFRKSGDVREKYSDSLRLSINNRVYQYGPYTSDSYAGRSLLASIKYFGYLLRESIRSEVARKYRDQIVSSAYKGIAEEFQKLGYATVAPPWLSFGFDFDPRLRRATRFVKKTIEQADFSIIFSDDFYKEIEVLEKMLKEYYLEKRALVVPYDTPFFENLSIKIFRELSKPIFVFLHGMPAAYNTTDNNRADYLLVWGEAIKKNFVTAGIPADKIFVSGHPILSARRKPFPKRSMNRILVISKPVPSGASFSDSIIIGDPGNSIIYLYEVEAALKDCGVKKAVLRIHPSENPVWYTKYIDMSFYSIDNSDLNTSLELATLVVGPSSSVFIDSLCAGRRYVIYEPMTQGKDGNGIKVFPPFDGAIPEFPTGGTVESLAELIRNGPNPDVDAIDDFIKKPFDLHFVRDILGSGKGLTKDANEK